MEGLIKISNSKNLQKIKHALREEEQPGLVEDVPAHGRGIGTRWFLRSLPTQTILWFYTHFKAEREKFQLVPLYHRQETSTALVTVSPPLSVLWDHLHYVFLHSPKISWVSKWPNLKGFGDPFWSILANVRQKKKKSFPNPFLSMDWFIDKSI